jgi:hypothetical protein
VDTCHALIDSTAGRASTYVALTRGRESNTAYVICERDADLHRHEPLATTARARMTDVLQQTDVPGTTGAELARRAGVVEGRELGWIGSQWDDITSEASRHHHTAILASLLDPDLMAVLVAEPGFRRLLRATRAADLAGHDLTARLAQVVDGRSLVGAESMSDVLRRRIHLTTGRRTPERTVEVGDWSTLSTPVEGPVGDYVNALAAVATARQTELGQQAAHERPAWAPQHLGEPPSDGAELGEWARRAGVVAAYRELRVIPDEAQSIGPAPAREQVLHRALWRHAHTVLGAPADELDYAEASDAKLWEMREYYRRELTWAPYDVHDELRDARLIATGYHRDAIIWRPEVEQHAPGTPQRATADADVTAADHLAARYDARVEHLEVIAAARDRWHHDTEHARTRHVFAGQELAHRGLLTEPVPDQGEQSTLFDIAEPVEPDTTVRDSGAKRRGQRCPSLVVQANEAVETALASTHAALHDITARGIESDPHQCALFTASPRPADIAAAEALREVSVPLGEEEDSSRVTLAQARRHAEITAELRAARERRPRRNPRRLRRGQLASSPTPRPRRAARPATLRALGCDQDEDLDTGVGV